MYSIEVEFYFVPFKISFIKWHVCVASTVGLNFKTYDDDAVCVNPLFSVAVMVCGAAATGWIEADWSQPSTRRGRSPPTSATN